LAVQGVGADLAGLDVAQGRADDPPDVALVRDPGRGGELGHLKVDVEDPAEEGVAFWGYVPLGLFSRRPSALVADVSSGQGFAETRRCLGPCSKNLCYLEPRYGIEP
jgi:hypothetical protein